MEEINNRNSVSLRVEFIDLTKGICICLVVFGHIAMLQQDNPSKLTGALYSFLMPLYYFLSGLFFKRYESFKIFFVKKVNVLLIPFIAFHFLTVIGWLTLTDIVGGRLSVDNFVSHLYLFFSTPCVEFLPDGPIWFLLSLFFTNLFFYGCLSLSDRFKHNMASLLFLTILLGSSGFYFNIYCINLPLFLDTTLTAFPFFVGGFILRNYTSFLENNWPIKYSCLFILIGSIVTYFLAEREYVYVLIYYDANFFQLYFGGFMGILTALHVSKLVGHIPLVSYFGRYSLIILVTHWFLYPYVSRVVESQNYPTIITQMLVFIITMLSYILIIPLFKRRFPHITAQKELIKFH